MFFRLLGALHIKLIVQTNHSALAVRSGSTWSMLHVRSWQSLIPTASLSRMESVSFAPTDSTSRERSASLSIQPASPTP